MKKTFYIETWGCQMNDLDTQRIAGHLRLRGYQRVESEQNADLVLLNTCSIREKADQKVFSRLGVLRELGPEVRIGVSGCVAQREGEAILERAPFVDFILGPGNVGNLDDLLSGARRVAVDFPEARSYDYLSIDRPSATRAQVTIIEGCNKNCTFCVVPMTRGREVSRPSKDIMNEIRFEVAAGRVEFELLGQTVNGYRCPESGAGFATLLDAVAKIEGVRRVRFVTSHPAEVTDDMIDAMKNNPAVARYMHLPVQSGSSAVLRRMKRLYTREKYLEVIGRIRQAIPEMHFSTDIIVGFPGETEGDFQQTLSLLSEVRFGSLFAFKYSPRPGTAALKLGPPVEDAIANERLTRLFDHHEEMKREILSGFRNQIVRVLYEGPSRKDDAMYSGRSEESWTVNFSAAGPPAVGDMVNVRIDEALHHTLRGEATA